MVIQARTSPRSANYGQGLCRNKQGKAGRPNGTTRGETRTRPPSSTGLVVPSFLGKLGTGVQSRHPCLLIDTQCFCPLLEKCRAWQSHVKPSLLSMALPPSRLIDDHVSAPQMDRDLPRRQESAEARGNGRRGFMRLPSRAAGGVFRYGSVMGQ
ncbi:uncharacterized protein CLUP02_15057 [Colletotrichum lupini]|uniref:Uncharacterized protein n=1 Tax=Colletotrichum lupini TaxID=145971 RepID=A0A9Q8WNB4_9PEZI|nr:uncharacterized protein CLUP02_15057 [Colletotrichum lupini]UQC89526.1 hypothetical protein CLUP02_15057 [Colletotrichum lupini]